MLTVKYNNTLSASVHTAAAFQCKVRLSLIRTELHWWIFNTTFWAQCAVLGGSNKLSVVYRVKVQPESKKLVLCSHAHLTERPPTTASHLDDIVQLNTTAWSYWLNMITQLCITANTLSTPLQHTRGLWMIFWLQLRQLRADLTTWRFSLLVWL